MFNSYFIGGFESSTHRIRGGHRIDMIAATQHDDLVRQDYIRLRFQGIRTAREAIRWHLIERTPGTYDFSTILPMVKAARELGIQVLWNLCHYGWPDDLDIYEPQFIERFAGLARAFAHVLACETDTQPFISPVNEISFFSWAGGDVAYFNPFTMERGAELKRQLVRATIAACDAVWSVTPNTRIMHIDPIVNITAPQGASTHERVAAEQRRLSHYEAWDMIAGRMKPQLGGHPRYLDIVGANYYHNNQWLLNDGTKIKRESPMYKPFSHMLAEVYERYGRPLFISETGIEDEDRPNWLRYICSEVRSAISRGVPVQGICLYPILNHPGWDNERHCYNGLWDYADDMGNREICSPLAQELQHQTRLFAEILQGQRDRQDESPMSLPLSGETYFASL